MASVRYYCATVENNGTGQGERLERAFRGRKLARREDQGKSIGLLVVSTGTCLANGIFVFFCLHSDFLRCVYFHGRRVTSEVSECSKVLHGLLQACHVRMSEGPALFALPRRL